MPRDPAGNYCFPRSQPDPDAVFECILRSSDRIMCAVQDGTFFFQEGRADDSSARVAWRMHEHAEFSTGENNNTYGAMHCAFYNNMHVHRCMHFCICSLLLLHLSGSAPHWPRLFNFNSFMNFLDLLRKPLTNKMPP